MSEGFAAKMKGLWIVVVMVDVMADVSHAAVWKEGTPMEPALRFLPGTGSIDH
ncbi:MAG: hypothetical protein M3Y72_27120 [Acidobacteriota bacterium]|nr:hypothetical protein [Acidobacteriota bacterium]